MAEAESESGSVAVGPASRASTTPGAEHRAERPGSTEATSRRLLAVPEHAVAASVTETEAVAVSAAAPGVPPPSDAPAPLAPVAA